MEIAARTGQSRAREKTGREVGRASLLVYGGGETSRLWLATASDLVGKGAGGSGTASWSCGSDIFAPRILARPLNRDILACPKSFTEVLSQVRTKQTKTNLANRKCTGEMGEPTAGKRREGSQKNTDRSHAPAALIRKLERKEDRLSYVFWRCIRAPPAAQYNTLASHKDRKGGRLDLLLGCWLGPGLGVSEKPLLE